MTLTRRIPFALTGLALATSFVLALPNAARADPRGHGGREGMHQMRGGGEQRGGMGLLRGLDLTQEQRDQAFKIFHDQAPRRASSPIRRPGPRPTSLSCARRA